MKDVKEFKVLNLYAGLGGNRKLWEGLKVTAVEINPEIAILYQNRFLQDKVIIGDAHKYLIDHLYDDWDFIWASPPCPSHSHARHRFVLAKKFKPIYPAMELYQEIILLQSSCKCLWVIENVKPYYEPLIKPTLIAGRHTFWANFKIDPYGKETDAINISKVKKGAFGFNHSKVQYIRNLVNPEIGLHILDCAMNKKRNEWERTPLFKL